MKNYMKILKYMKPYWFLASLAPVFLIGEVTFLLLIPKTSGEIIDIGINEGDLQKVISMSLMMLLYTVISVIFGFLSLFFANYSSESMSNDLRIETFQKALNMSFTNLDEFKIGKVITRITSDTNMLRMMTRMFLRGTFRAPYLIIGAIFIIIQINLSLALILLSAIPIIFIANYFIVKKSYPVYRQVQEKLENINTYTQENLENIRVVKAFNRSQYANDNFDDYIDALQNKTIKANIITSFNAPIFMFVMNMCLIAVLYIGGLDVINGLYDAGTIVAFLGYLGQITMALSMINGMIRMIPRAGASSTRLVELFEVDSELGQAKYAIKDIEIKGKIEFKNVSFGFNNEKAVLKNVSFKVESGERLGVIGTTGSGKTSLVNLIPRFYDVLEGEVLIDDINVKDYDIKTLRKQISTVMQRPLLFAGTIEDNIKLGAMYKDEDEVLFASKNAEAYEFISTFNDGYQTILGERGINLSGGQKQRLSMSRSFITDPKILIFDDSTSAVDMITERKILTSLNKNVTSTTIIIIAQRIRSVMNADKILVLENGCLTGYGTHEELLNGNTLYQDIYNMQMGEDEDE